MGNRQSSIVNSPDPRHAPIRELIGQIYAQANGGLTVPWTGRTAGILKRLLDANQRWPLEIWLRCVRNRFSSEGLNLAEDPVRWLSKLVNYARGPLNRFGEPMKRAASVDPIEEYWKRRRAEL
jgi:hypothetical protein